MDVDVPFVFRGRCQRECLNAFADSGDRWAHTACGNCCVKDVDDNGYIDEEDMDQHYEDFCGHTTKMITREIDMLVVTGIIHTGVSYSMNKGYVETVRRCPNDYSNQTKSLLSLTQCYI